MDKNILWYKRPASFKKWEEQALVIGNGYMGASFFGGIAREKIVFNEKTLWRGGPSPDRPDYNGGNIQGSYVYVRQVQDLLFEGKYKEAEELLPRLTGGGDGYGAYQLLCEAYLRFSNIDEARVEDYRRFLDMNDATCTTTFTYNGAKHTRTAFANYPDNIICIKLTADKPRRICVRLELSNLQSNCEIFTSGSSVAYVGSLLDNGLQYAANFEVEVKGGELITGDYNIMAEHADEVVIYVSAATNYAPVYPHYRKEIFFDKIISDHVCRAKSKGWEQLYCEHKADYCDMFSRVKLCLTPEAAGLPTDELVSEYKTTADREGRNALEELYFQFGRYALISSSRQGSLPANLQGVWNEKNSPPWNSDYHINVNLQMNYWGAYNTNLAETVPPLVDFLDSMREAGRVTAKEYYGIISDENNPENGWIAHTETTPFGWTSPGYDFYWGWSTAAVAWLMQNIWEYYEFTGDRDYLENRIYPIMRESARFYSQWLIYDEKQERLVSSPTYSPEHGPVSIGNTYEQSLISQFYSDFITASEILEKDTELRETVKKQRELLNPYKVGASGKLLEWFEEEESDFDNSKVMPMHRHISHLMGLYPGKEINSSVPDLLNATICTLNDRGDESTGWARAYKLNLWARIAGMSSAEGMISSEEISSAERTTAEKYANRAYKLLSGLIADSTYVNLFDFHPPFQLDGNFGGSAGIAEMLLQSHEGYINPLPSLPDVWRDGNVSGLCARGGFTVNMEWAEAKLIKLEIKSALNNICRVKASVRNILCGGNTVGFSEENGICVFIVAENEVYNIELS